MDKKRIRDNVEMILEKYPKTRDDDKLLVLQYWNKVDGISIKKKRINVNDILSHATTAESITRARRLVQNDRDDLQPTREVKESRVGKERRMRESVFRGEVV